MSEIVIAGRRIAAGRPPLIVAELSGNHNGSLAQALAIVDAAAEAGAHAVKLQTYTADTMTLDLPDPAFAIDDASSLWNGRSLYELYREAATPWEWHGPLFERCRARGVIPFSTPFDASAVELLERLGAPAYKIASFEITDLPLIERVAATGKPLLISTGMADIAEIDEAVRAARRAGCDALILLKCTSAYPAPPSSINLRTIPHMRELFGVDVGLSDHSPGIGVAVAAVALGASVIEKHVTLSRAAGGVDAAFSIEPRELRDLVAETARASEALGHVHYGASQADRASLRFRRSLHVVEDLEPGAALTEWNLRAIRPGGGLAPKYLPVLLGRRVVREVKRGTPVDWSFIA
ncbi:MAG: pseudaminic acid synthase [Acidobacteria bacterium]|nr:pseudaminic acid synthase [Acidobacteriota bacterium]